MTFRALILFFSAVLPVIADEVQLGRPPQILNFVETIAEKRKGPPTAEFGTTFSLNTQNREEVRNFYKTVYAASTNWTMSWDGNVATCAAGTTADFFKDQVLLRVNFYRAMAGVPTGILFSNAYSLKDQEAALMISANNNLSHFPPSSWTCFTTNGATASANSDIALGATGPEALDAYMKDNGNGNADVGHRRWICYPQTRFMGTGDIPSSAGHSANALWVIDDNLTKPRPATREAFVSWPPPGFFPYQLAPSRWSISYPNANFSAASVTVLSNGVSMAITLETVQNGFGENTLVWFPNWFNPILPIDWPKVSGDTVFDVNVTGVTGTGVPASFSYQVKLFDPAVDGLDTARPTISGPDTINTSQSANFTFTKLNLGTAYDVRVRDRVAALGDGAETGLGNFLVNTSGNYNVIITAPVAGGSQAFRFTHLANRLQTMTFANPMFVRAGGKLNFASRLGIASTPEFAKVRVSTDGGATYTEIFSQSGNASGTPIEATYVNRSLALDAFVGKVILVRFAFEAGSGSVISSSFTDVGWYFDEISFVNVDELKNPTIFTASPEGTFSFTALTPGGYALEVRAQLYGEFLLDFGPTKAITAIVDLTPVIQFQPAFLVGESTVQMDFSVSHVDPASTLLLLKGPSVEGPWETDTTAVFETITAGSAYRVTIPKNSDPVTVYQVKAQ